MRQNKAFINESINALLDNEPGVSLDMNVYISARHCFDDKNRHANKFRAFSCKGVTKESAGVIKGQMLL